MVNSGQLYRRGRFLGPLCVTVGGSVGLLRVGLRATWWVRWRDIVKRDPCAYCCLYPNWQREKARMSVEHVVPQSVPNRPRGWENIAGAHASCNHDRGDMSLLWFLVFKSHIGALGGRSNYAARRELRRLFKVRRAVA